MSSLRLIAVMTFPLASEDERKGVEKKIIAKFKGLHKGSSVYFRQDMVDNVFEKPDELK